MFCLRLILSEGVSGWSTESRKFERTNSSKIAHYNFFIM